MKLKFIIDKNHDIDFTIYMLGRMDYKYFANEIGMSLDLATRINNEYPRISTKTENDLNAFVDKRYDEVLEYMKDSKRLYQKSWNLIIDNFSDIVSDITESKWYYNEYICTISAFHRGISNWGGNTIVRWWQENHYIQRRITAHEIILAHYFSIYRDKYSSFEIGDKKIWALAEICAWAITGLDENVITKFWPWDNSGYYTDHNYPNLVPLQLKMKEAYLKRKNFDEYIRTGMKLVKKYEI